MELDVEMKAAVVAVVSGRLMQRHDVRECNLLEIVETDDNVLQNSCQILHFSIVQLSNARTRCLGCNEDFVGVPCEERNECDSRVVLTDNAPSVGLLSRENVLEDGPSISF